MIFVSAQRGRKACKKTQTKVSKPSSTTHSSYNIRSVSRFVCGEASGDDDVDYPAEQASSSEQASGEEAQIKGKEENDDDDAANLCEIWEVDEGIWIWIWDSRSG